MTPFLLTNASGPGCPRGQCTARPEGLAVFLGLALFALVACTPQTRTVPPVAEEESSGPAMDIWQASAEGALAALEENRRAGADLDGLMPGEARVTPLTVAVVSGQFGSVKWLLNHGANVNARNGDGSTALGAAAFLGRDRMAKMLLGSGSDASIRNNSGQSVLDIATLDWATTEYIANMLQLPVDRATVEGGRAKIVAMLRSASAYGWDALAELIVGGNTAAIKVALGKGANPNARDPGNGTTALILAAFLGRVDIAKMLLSAGADLKAVNNDGSTALSVAELDWATTEYIASMFGIPISDRDEVEKGKGEIARMLRAKW